MPMQDIRSFAGSISLVVFLSGATVACDSEHAVSPLLGEADTARSLASPQVPLAPSAIPQFIEPLPLLRLPGSATGSIATVLGNTPLTIRMCEFWAHMLPTGTFTPGVAPKTRVWGYIVGAACPPNGPNDPALDTYLGPVIVSAREHFDTCNTATSACSAAPSVACASDADCRIPTEITWINELADAASTGVLAYKYSTDQTLHWADPLGGEANACAHAGTIPAYGSPCAQNYGGPIPAAVHLHGGEVPPEIDGGPDAWFTSDGSHRGHGYYTSSAAPANAAIYRYPNTQQAGPLWFHDHTLGATRLNVYAGLAGVYYLHDPALNLPSNLQPLTEVVPLIIQDRMFDTNGQLFLQSNSAGGIQAAPNPEHPYWTPEVIGDTIAVNGKVWPYLAVDGKRYRFLLLNGSNARTYELSMRPALSMWVIGVDGGYLDAPARTDKLVMQPGERYEIIVDFAGVAGKTLTLLNNAKAPYPNGAPPQGATVGRVLQIRVAAAPAGGDTSYNPAAGTPLRQGTQTIARLADPVAGTLAAGVVPTATRQLTLNEVIGAAKTVISPVTGVLTTYPGGPLEVLVNNTKWTGTARSDFTPVVVGGTTAYYSELPREGDIELWEIVNLTADAHPIHLHLVQFQIVNRQRFNSGKYNAVYDAAFGTLPLPATCAAGVYCPGYGPPLDYKTGNPRALGGNPDITPWLQGKAAPPAPTEAGWKDTVVAYPGEVTRIVVRWAPNDVPAAAAPAARYFPFDPTGGGQHGYVWHCHIIDHEDNEMMRPTLVRPSTAGVPAPAARPLVSGIDY